MDPAVQKRKKKVLFAAYDFKFIKDIMQGFERHPDFIVRLDQWVGFEKHNSEKSKELLNWADIIFAEWCLGNAVWYSNQKLPHQKLFVRLHRFEGEKRYPSQVNLKNVDKMIFIAPYIQERMKQKLNVPDEQTVVIYNAVDIKKFNLNKKEEARFNLGLLGYTPKLKRLDKAIVLFEKLKQKDERYTLYIKGRRPQEVNWLWRTSEERHYFTKLFDYINKSPYKDSIIFEDWGEDAHEWFRKIGFILSTSDIEGSHQAVAEGMSSGALPIIHGDWNGSEFIFPAEFIKKDLDQAIATIISYNQDRKLLSECQRKAVKHCSDHFHKDKIINQWVGLI